MSLTVPLLFYLLIVLTFYAQFHLKLKCSREILHCGAEKEFN